MRGNGAVGDTEVANASSLDRCCATQDGDDELVLSNSIIPQPRNSTGANRCSMAHGRARPLVMCRNWAFWSGRCQPPHWSMASGRTSAREQGAFTASVWSLNDSRQRRDGSPDAATVRRLRPCDRRARHRQGAKCTRSQTPTKFARRPRRSDISVGPASECPLPPHHPARAYWHRTWRQRQFPARPSHWFQEQGEDA